MNQKAVRILDLIPEATEEQKMDKYYVLPDDDMGWTDLIELASETEEKLVFKYWCTSKDSKQTIVYQIGK